MAPRRFLEPEGLNWWIILSGIGMNLVLTMLLLIGVVLLRLPEQANRVVVLSLGAFLIPLATAYVCGRIGDDRFMAYAFYSLLGFLIVTVPGLLAVGLIGLLVIAFGVLGAFNGALLATRLARRPRHVPPGPPPSHKPGGKT